MTSRPRLAPHARVLRRGANSVQVGLTPDRGVVLVGLSGAEIDLLSNLDGSARAAQARRRAMRHGSSAERLHELLGVLRAHGLLYDVTGAAGGAGGAGGGPRQRQLAADAAAVAATYPDVGDGHAVVSARSHRQAVVQGVGGLSEAIAGVLRSGGLGRVWCGPHAASAWDQDLRRGATADLPDVVILVATGAVSEEDGEPWRRRGVPHLPVVASPPEISIGPLVQPGGPCLRCLNLVRADRDPGWPAVLAQLTAPSVGPPPPDGVDSALTTVTAGLVAMMSHVHLDAQALPCGLSVELSFGVAGPALRRWRQHPRCRCGEGGVTIGA